MGIGAIGAYGSVYGIQTPYLYNTNRLSANSLNPVRAIGPDVVRAPKTDYSGLIGGAYPQENTNPLKPYETSDFNGILEKQMALSRQNALRIMQE